MKKLLVLVFAIALCLGVLCLGASADGIMPSKPAQDADGVYQIGTEAELYWFAGLVNGTLTDGTAQNTAAHAKLTNNITINTGVLNTDGTLNDDADSFAQWTPIGTSNAYTGTFDGGGHSISGLYYSGNNDSGNVYAGLFGCVGSGGEVKNVKVADSYISVTVTTAPNQLFAGGVCASNYGTITNCSNAGSVTGQDGTVEGFPPASVGGVCGQNYGTVTNCCNSGSVSGDCAGGVCGENISGGTITNCSNTGSVSGYYAGGVCGRNYGTVTNCCNSGSVSGDCAGGVCGENISGGTITNCCNSGSVSGTNAGGVCGLNGGEITNCYNSGSVTGSGTGTNYAGGVCGENISDGTITNCYWLNTSCNNGIGCGTATSVEAKTAKDFASGEVTWLLNQGQTGTWRQNIGTDTYPVLDSESGVVVQLTVDKDEEDEVVMYFNIGDEFEGEDGKVYFSKDNEDERITLPYTVDADTNLTSRTLVTVTANDIVIYFEEKLPDLTFTTRPEVIVNGVNMLCDFSAAKPGKYPILIGGPPVQGDYAFDYVFGTLTVLPSWIVTIDGEVYYAHPGESYKLPDAPSKPGYIFLGWRSGDKTYGAGDEVYITGDTSFTAVWANMPDITPSEPEALPFTDVSEGAWYYDAVCYVCENGIMEGVETDEFAPNSPLTRAMVWAVLARLDGVEVSGDNWITVAQEWVVAKGISDGENPSAAITRQELVTMLWRLSGEPVVNYTLTSPDAYAISGWAYEAMRWAVSEGIIEGDDLGNLNPTANSTRAHAAAFMQRFCTAL